MSLVTRTALASAWIWILGCGEIARAPTAPAKPKSPIAAIATASPEAEIAPVPIDVQAAASGRAPQFGGGAPLFSNAGSFNLGTTSPGSASYVQSPVVDYFGSTAPASFGTGGWQSIAAGGSTFTNAMAESIAGVLPDDRGIDYLLLTAYTEEIDPATGATIGTVVHTIVLASDFSVGGSVNLDGVDRLAIFARGDIDLPEPQLAAAAVTGTITFSAGGLALGDLISADLTADFGDFTWPTAPPPPTGTNNLTPGNYTIHYDPMPMVTCDGTLIGQEAQFAAITAASVGFADGPVSLAAGTIAGNFDISGAPITSGYGVATLTLEAFPDAPPGIVGGYTNGSGNGPANTTFYGTYLVLDGTTATATDVFGWAGAGYVNAAQDGFCSVDFLVELGP
jgi:hypothetical protein